jgi:peptidoglycan hydrolase CwlO-like protein
MKKASFYLLFFFFLISGCHKPASNPESLDPIFTDLEKQTKDVAVQVTDTQKQLDDFEKAMETVQPQTGQIKYAQKRVYETRARLEKLQQKLRYLQLHTETRLNEDRKAYLRAFNKNEPWPDPAEYESYKAQRALEETPIIWNVNARKERFLSPPPKHGASEENGSEH